MINRFVLGTLDSVTFDTSIKIASPNEKEIIKLQDVSIGSTSVRAKYITARERVNSRFYSVYDENKGDYVTGHSGTFTTADGKTVTVINGIITSV